MSGNGTGGPEGRGGDQGGGTQQNKKGGNTLFLVQGRLESLV